MTVVLSAKAEELALEMCREAGDFAGELTEEQREEVLSDFYTNKASHEIDDLNDAAEGDVAALVRARQACGLPILR